MELEMINQNGINIVKCILPHSWENKNLAGKALTNGIEITLSNGLCGLSFDYCDGKPLIIDGKIKKVFLDAAKYPEVSKILNTLKNLRIERLKHPQVKQAQKDFGWCENCQSWCYSDCQA
jgi:hypothetical protein